MTWYRVHNDILDNPKLLMLAPSDRWHFIALLSLKSQGVLDQFKGDKLNRVVCAKLRLTRGEWDECSRRMQEEDLIDHRFQPVGWSDRQFATTTLSGDPKKYIYFAGAEDGPVKIGISKNPWARIKDFQTGSADKLSVVATVRTTETSEVHIHDLFSNVRRNGEWFSRTDEIIQVINEIQSKNLKLCSDIVNYVAQLRSCEVVTTTDTDTDTDTDKTNSEPASAVSATAVAKPVDNFQTLGEAYRSPSAEQIIFNRGAALLGQHGIADQAARKFLGMCKQQSGAGRTLDAVVVTLLSQPSGDPKAFILGVLANQPAEIPGTWEPDPGVVGELEGLGIPMHMIRNARDAFVVWFSDMEIRHSNWPRLFKDWVIRDWERAEFNAQLYRSNLAKSAGLAYSRPFQEPA